jgi:hypothetical protein
MSVAGSAVASSGGRRAAVALVLLLVGLVSGWIGVGLVAEKGVCDNQGHCYALPDAVGRRVPWELFAAASLGTAAAFLGLAVLAVMDRLAERRARRALLAGFAVCIVQSLTLHRLSNVFYDGGQPYVTGERKVLSAAVPLIPALGAVLLILSDLRRYGGSGGR